MFGSILFAVFVISLIVLMVGAAWAVKIHAGEPDPARPDAGYERLRRSAMIVNSRHGISVRHLAVILASLGLTFFSAFAWLFLIE